MNKPPTIPSEVNNDGRPMTPAWYAVYTRSRHEQVVYDQLCAKGVTAFLPKVEIWSRRTDRRKRIQVPMFPGYLFVYFDLHPEKHLAILKTIGVVNIVTTRGKPAEVDPRQISSLQILIDSGMVIHPAENFAKGDQVRITDGPFKSVIGKLVGKRSNRRLIVEVQTINQAVSVEVEEHVVIKAETI